MKKPVLSAFVLFFSVAFASAQSPTPQVMSGSNPSPQVMSGSNPSPQVMSGSNPSPQIIPSTGGTVLSAILAFFGL